MRVVVSSSRILRPRKVTVPQRIRTEGYAIVSADSMIALSLSDSGEDRLLGAVEIGGWNAEAGLIVLSGCGSGAAVARPGAGLMGMTRAWLMAGARAVVATGWSTPDDVGVFFGRFYRRLGRSEARDPALALQAAQIPRERFTVLKPGQVFEL